MLPEVPIWAMPTAAACSSVSAASMAAAMATVSPKVLRNQAASTENPAMTAATRKAWASLKALAVGSSTHCCARAAARRPNAALSTSTPTAAAMGHASACMSPGAAAHTTASNSSSEARLERIAAELAAIIRRGSVFTRCPKLAVAAVDEAKPEKNPVTASPQRTPAMRMATCPSMPMAMTSTTIIQTVRGSSTPQGSTAWCGSRGMTTSSAARMSSASLSSCSVTMLRLMFCSWALACSSMAATTPSPAASCGSRTASPASAMLSSSAVSPVSPRSVGALRT